MPLVVVAFFQFGYNTTIYSTAASSQSAVDAPWAYQNQNQQNTGYSPQNMINSSNVGSLQQVWAKELTGLTGTPVVANGMIYVTGSGSIDALREKTGKLIWADDKKDIGHSIKTSSGVTIAKGSVFAGTTDNNLVSLNALTGSVNWLVPIANNVTGSMHKYEGAEETPLVFDGKVIVGETTSDNGARGIVRAFSESSGLLLWTFYTVPPAPINATNQDAYGNSWGTNGTSGCLCGGGDVWGVPAVDPNSGIIYFGTGNAFPYNSLVRTPNSSYCSLWTDSVLAVNSSNGKLVWGFQEVCGDPNDLDQGMPVQLFNATINHVKTEIVGAGGKAGAYFLLNAHNGNLIYKVNVGIRPTNNKTSPSRDIGINTFSSYDPKTNMIYTETNNQPNGCRACLMNSSLYAIDPSTGIVVWNRNLSITAGGVSSTNSIVLTSGNHTFLAFNGLTGAVLWNFSVPSGNSPYRWSWGPPSVANGMVFETTWGVTSDGYLEAFALPK